MTLVVTPAQAGVHPLQGRSAKMKEPCVYLLASRRNGTLYVGVTVVK